MPDGLTKYRALARDYILLIKKERMNVLSLFLDIATGLISCALTQRSSTHSAHSKALGSVEQEGFRSFISFGCAGHPVTLRTPIGNQFYPFLELIIGFRFSCSSSSIVGTWRSTRPNRIRRFTVISLEHPSEESRNEQSMP